MLTAEYADPVGIGARGSNSRAKVKDYSFNPTPGRKKCFRYGYLSFKSPLGENQGFFIV
jgi:hypothetical protein